jgi:hypothetical protein
MRCVPLLSLAMALACYASQSMGQVTALPDSADVTRDSNNSVIAVRIQGRSDSDRLSLTLAALKEIASFKRLESLSLWGTSVDDDDIERLAGLENLRAIDLSFTDVTGGSLRTLSSMKRLVSVRLEGCDVRDEHLSALAEMPQLGMLYLGRTKVTDAGLKPLRELKKINLLQLSDCAVTDAGLASLGDLPDVQHLWLSKTIRYGNDDRSHLTDGCIDYLLSLDTLIDLQIADSQLTEDGVNRLREGLPNAKVGTERTGITYTTLDPLLRELPSGVYVERSADVSAANRDAIARKLGGLAVRITNSILRVHGRSLQVNVITAANASNAKTIHASLTKIKPYPFSVRSKEIVVEYVGANVDVAIANKTSYELGLVKKPDSIKYRVVAELATVDEADYMGCNALFNQFLALQRGTSTDAAQQIQDLSTAFTFGRNLVLRNPSLSGEPT